MDCASWQVTKTLHCIVQDKATNKESKWVGKKNLYVEWVTTSLISVVKEGHTSSTDIMTPIIVA